MSTYNPVKRESDGTTVRLDKQEAEQADIDARAKRVISVDSSGDNISVTNPLPIIISDGVETVDVIPTNGLNGLVSITPGHVSIDNTTEDPDLLLADETFTGEWENIVNFGVIVVSVTSDATSATDGLMVQFSTDGTENGIVADDVFTIAAGIKKTFSFQAAAKFFRVLYTNGGSDQGHFHLQTILKPYYVKPSSHRIDDEISSQDDAELIKSVITYQSTGTDTFKNIGVQVPLPTDGDSLYEKDINIEKSDNGGFSGDVIDYFNSLNSVNNDVSATNPKVIKVWLKRTAFASALGLGCDDLSKNFSNIKLELFGSGEVIRNTIDESSDDTKRNSFLFEFSPTAFNGFILSFHTADEVGLSNITMPKEVQVVSRLKAIKPDGVVTDIDATMGGNLKVSVEEFDPTFLDNPLPVTKGFNIPIYDDIDITYVAAGNGQGEIETIVYKAATVTVATLTLSYNSDNKLTDVVQT